VREGRNKKVKENKNETKQRKSEDGKERKGNRSQISLSGIKPRMSGHNPPLYCSTATCLKS
jgi:hypothetical protein